MDDTLEVIKVLLDAYSERIEQVQTGDGFVWKITCQCKDDFQPATPVVPLAQRPPEGKNHQPHMAGRE